MKFLKVLLFVKNWAMTIVKFELFTKRPFFLKPCKPQCSQIRSCIRDVFRNDLRTKKPFYRREQIEDRLIAETASHKSAYYCGINISRGKIQLRGRSWEIFVPTYCFFRLTDLPDISFFILILQMAPTELNPTRKQITILRWVISSSWNSRRLVQLI